MTIKSIPLSQLVPSPANVRKTNATRGVEELAASIEAHGLLQNLQVRKGGNGKYEVVAGGRLLDALRFLAKRKKVAADFPVPCAVRDGNDATEISLAENEMRQAMHPADQFEAFKALIDAGHGPEEVAARFGVTVKVVQQRMKLAAVSRKLFALYRKGEMNLDQLMAFTVSGDHAEQEAAWFETSDWQRSAHDIRQRLTAAHVADSDKRVMFVTVDAYVAAGGSVITDLFQTKRYLADPALLDRLDAGKLEREAEAVRAEGWKWVEIMPEIDWDTRRGFEELRGKRQPLPPKDAKKLAKLEKEHEALSELDEYTDDELDRCERLDAEIAALEESAFVFSDRQKARSGAFVSIGRDGNPEIVRGLVRPADVKAEKREEAEAEGETLASAPGLSRSLIDDLTAHRTAALRARLAEEPLVALATLVHALVQTVFYDEGEESALAITIATPSLRAEGIDDSAAMKRLIQLRGVWVTDIPEQPEALWDWLLARDTGTLFALLAHCVACTVKPERGTAADRLASAVTLDMEEWWQPSAAYFGRLPKALILDAVAEGKGKSAAVNLATLKKGEMASKAADLLTGSGWLPTLLRAA
jgi:ParB family chromosome partitioning protein